MVKKDNSHRTSKLNKLGKSFTHAYRGIIYCITNEQNMRIHLSVAFLVLSFAHTYHADKLELITILFCIGLVISCEMINTSIETITNLSTPAYNNLAKITKDVAAGAVLVTTIIAVLIGLLIFGDIVRLQNTILYILQHQLVLLYYVVGVVGSIIFIFHYPTIYHSHKQKKKKGN